MKNKIFSTIVAAYVCGAMITSRAFAEDVTTDNSIYAPNAEAVAERINSSLMKTDKFYVKAETVMPIYHSSVYDYAKTGMFEFVPETSFGGQSYFADTFNEDGSFAGPVMIGDNGENADVQMYMPTNDESFMLDYYAKADHIKELMEENGISIDITEAKVAWVTGLGFVYYINNGTDEVFYRVKFKGGTDRYFIDENCEFAVVDDEFKAMAKADLAEELSRGERTNVSYDGNPPTDGSNPSTGGTSSGVAAVSVLAACGVVLSRKKNRK